MSNTSRVAPLVNAAATLISSSLMDTTLVAYNNTLLQFHQFINKLHPAYRSFPANPGHIILYLTSLYIDGLAPSTIASRLSAIAYFHKLRSVPDPTSHFLVAKAMAGMRKLNPATDARLPISLQQLHNLMCNSHIAAASHYYSALYSAMSSLCFYAFLRPGEVTDSHNNLSLDSLQFSEQGLQIIFIRFKHHHGQPVTINIPRQPHPTCPVSAVSKYLRLRGDAPGPLFCHLDLHPITYKQFQNWFGLTIAACAIPGRLNLHSYRIGAATWAAAKGIPAITIQQMGRWKSSAYLRYIRIPVISLGSP